MLTSFSAKHFDANVIERCQTEHFLIEKCSYFGVKLIKQYIFKPKCNCRRKSMQEKESVMVVQCELKIPTLGITVRHHSASLVMPNSYPRDGIFNPHLTTIKDSYIIASPGIIGYILSPGNIHSDSLLHDRSRPNPSPILA